MATPRDKYIVSKTIAWRTIDCDESWGLSGRGTTPLIVAKAGAVLERWRLVLRLKEGVLWGNKSGETNVWEEEEEEEEDGI